MQRWHRRAQSLSLLRYLQGNATLHTATLQPISGQQLQRTSRLKRTGEERWFCKTVMSHASDDTLLTSEEPEEIKHNVFHSPKTDENKAHDVLYRCRNEERFVNLETSSDTDDSLLEVQSCKISNILSSGDASIQECLQPFVKCLSPRLVARVLNQVPNVEMEKFFFDWAAKQVGYKHDVFVYNTFLMKLSLTKQFDFVWKLVKKMQSEDCAPTSTTFAIIIQNYIEARNSQQCWRVFEEAQRLGVKLDAHIYTALMHALFDVRNVEKAKQVFRKIRECNLELDIHIWSTVIHGLCKSKKMRDAADVFEQMQTSGCMPNADVYNAMIVGFCESNDPKKAFPIYDLMQKQGCKPRTCTYDTILKAYCSLDMFAEADGLISNMQDSGREPNQVTFNIFLGGLLEKEKTMEAASLFHKMHKMGMVDSNSYRIYALSVKRLGGESKLVAFSEKLFSKYGTCDVEVCNTILQYYCEIGELSKASKYLGEIFVNMSTPNEFSYTLMIDAFCKSGDFNSARSFLSRMDERGCKATDMSYKPVVMALCKHFKELEALQLFENMNQKGIQASSATCDHLLRALSDAGLADAAIRLCHYITERRQVIERLTAFSFIKCLSKSNRLEEANVLLRAMQKQGCIPKKSRSFKCALFSMMRGEFDEVEKYFRKQLPNNISYFAMLMGSCKKGKLDKAKSILSQMKEQECAPNAAYYNPLILRLSKSSNRLMESFELFEEMWERGVVPFGKLQNSLMQTFCRAKQEDVIMKLGKLIIAKGLTVERGTVSFLLRQADESELKKLYFELNDNNCLVDSVATDNEEELELDGEVSE